MPEENDCTPSPKLSARTRPDNGRWVICGGRNFDDQEMFDAVMRDFVSARLPPAMVLHGAQTGADTMAGRWARRFSIPVQAKSMDDPDFAAFPEKVRGPKRNAWIVANWQPSLCIGFPGGVGTVGMMIENLMQEIETWQITPKGRARWVEPRGTDP